MKAKGSGLRSGVVEWHGALVKVIKMIVHNGEMD